MSVTSWFPFPKFSFSAAVTKPSRRPAPTTRPFLESLEERAVPSAASNNLLGGANNATNFQAFNTQQSGINLPSSPVSSQLNGLAVGTFPNEGTSNALGPALGAMSAPLTQDQLNAQLRSLAANSQGQQGQPTPFTPNSIFFNSYGFGSGTQPNQPWVPNAYNLGLANGQWTFPSMADFGSLQSFGIRYPRFAHLQQPDNDADRPEQFLVPRDARAAADVEPADTPEAPGQQDRDDPVQIDPDSDAVDRPIPIVVHGATEDANAVQAAMRKQAASVESVLSEAGLSDVRAENAADKEVLQARLLNLSQAYVPQEDVFAVEKPVEPADEGQFLDSDLVHDLPALESLNLPGTLLLTVLTPAQFMVLLAEFPVATVPSERGEEIAEYSELE